jgi:hypothetical protein
MNHTLKTVVEQFIKVSLYSYYDRTLPANELDKSYLRKAVKETYNKLIIAITEANKKPEPLMRITEKLVDVAIMSYFAGVDRKFFSITRRIAEQAYDVLFEAIQQTNKCTPN